MAQIVITITDTPEKASTVEVDMHCEPRFEPNMFDPELTDAQMLASSVLATLETARNINRTVGRVTKGGSTGRAH